MPLKDSNCKPETKIICINLKENLMKKRKVTIKSRCLCGRRLWLTLTMKYAKIIKYMTDKSKCQALQKIVRGKNNCAKFGGEGDETHEFALFSAQKP